MFTKAGKQALQVVAIQPGENSANNAKPMFPNSPVKNANGVDRWVSWINGALYNTFNPQTALTNSGVHFGSSDIAPSEDDYHLKEPITSGFNSSLVTSERGVDGTGKPYSVLSYTVTNRTSSNMTIKEIGIITWNIVCCNSSTATSASNDNILVDRTVLNSPVVIEPNQTATIRYKVTCSMTFA